jgi:hypothetical protein
LYRLLVERGDFKKAEKMNGDDAMDEGPDDENGEPGERPGHRKKAKGVGGQAKGQIEEL